jgi:hypothetical protein
MMVSGIHILEEPDLLRERHKFSNTKPQSYLLQPIGTAGAKSQFRDESEGKIKKRQQARQSIPIHFNPVEMKLITTSCVARDCVKPGVPRFAVVRLIKVAVVILTVTSCSNYIYLQASRDRRRVRMGPRSELQRNYDLKNGLGIPLCYSSLDIPPSV